MRKAKQLSLEYPIWGGQRKGSGRKRRNLLPTVPHRARPHHVARFPLHITVRLLPGLPSLRDERGHACVLRALVASTCRSGLSFVHYSAMPNHIHLVCEAESGEAIARGMASFLITLSLSLNRTLGRKGRVFASRYHCRTLETPLEVHRALSYVLLNARNHGIHHIGVFDPFSSARWFEGWTEEHVAPRGVADSGPLPRARTWLLAVGAGLHGRIDPCIERDDKRHRAQRTGNPPTKKPPSRGTSTR